MTPHILAGAATFTLLIFSGYNNSGPDQPPMNIIQSYYEEHKGDSLPSICQGTEAGGSMEHGKLMPFHGENFRCYDTGSYLEGHEFVSDKLMNTLLNSYAELKTTAPGRMWCYMETGLKNGGPIPGHRTHQNGRSADFMVPLMKDSVPYYGFDSLGGWHYALKFDDKGRYVNDSTIAIDFNLLALQVLSIDKHARKQGMHIKKVILMLELKDDFYATPNGKKVKNKGIYFAMNLPEGTNKQHDDHIHVDIEPVK